MAISYHITSYLTLKLLLKYYQTLHSALLNHSDFIHVFSFLLCLQHFKAFNLIFLPFLIIIADPGLGLQGVIDVDEIMCSYDFTWHPDVKDGEIIACSRECI